MNIKKETIDNYCEFLNDLPINLKRFKIDSIVKSHRVSNNVMKHAVEINLLTRIKRGKYRCNYNTPVDRKMARNLVAAINADVAKYNKGKPNEIPFREEKPMVEKKKSVITPTVIKSPDIEHVTKPIISDTPINGKVHKKYRKIKLFGIPIYESEIIK